MDLSTGIEITRSQVDEAVMTELVIKQVERMVDKRGFGDSLKFTGNKRRILVPDPDLTGVDMEFQLEELDDENYNPVEEEDEDLIAEENITEEEIEDLRENEVQDQGPETDDRPETVDENECQGNNNEEEEEKEEAVKIPEQTEDNEENDNDVEEDSNGEQNVRRSGRERRAPEKLSYAQAVTCDDNYFSQGTGGGKVVKFADQIREEKDFKVEMSHNILTQVMDEDKCFTYTKEQAVILAQLMVDIREIFVVHGVSFMQRYSYKKGVKALGESARRGAYVEVEQMHTRNAFESIHVKNMTATEKRKAQMGLMLIEQKEEKQAKGRLVYNGKPTREWLSREDTSSPTVSQEGLHITLAIDAKEGRDVMSADIPNAFIQTRMRDKVKDERIIMKVQGDVVEFLLKIAPQTYAGYVVYERSKKTLYLVVLSAIYGMLEASMLFYKKLRGDLEAIGFAFNPYEPCVCNRSIRGSQHTVRFHVDDLLSSHVDGIVNDKFAKWLNKMYGKHGKKVKVVKGNHHQYLGMSLEFISKKKQRCKNDDV